MPLSAFQIFSNSSIRASLHIAFVRFRLLGDSRETTSFHKLTQTDLLPTTSYHPYILQIQPCHLDLVVMVAGTFRIIHITIIRLLVLLIMQEDSRHNTHNSRQHTQAFRNGKGRPVKKSLMTAISLEKTILIYLVPTLKDKVKLGLIAFR